MVHAHLRAAPHADHGVHGPHFVEPEVHDAHLHLGRAERRLDDGVEIDPLLQDVVRSLLRRNGGDLRPRVGPTITPLPANEYSGFRT